MQNLSGTPRYPFVLFDLGGTLLYYQGDKTAVLAESLLAATRFLTKLGYDLNEHAFLEDYQAQLQAYYRKRLDLMIEYTAEQVMRDVLRCHGYPEPPRDHLLQALRAMYAVSQQHWLLEEDAIPMLESLRASGRRLGIVSNAADDEDVQTLVDLANLRPYFDFVITSAAVSHRKPSQAIFKLALDYWGAKPEQVAMVGDTLSADVEGANRSGITSIWISRRAEPEEIDAEGKQYQPDAVIAALKDLPALLDCL